ncbi:methylglyoxal synthase [Bosea sp. BIWAKO-01]|uniref:methylglyoxal synthase n=1 Tax=Bosea sp. BIWAKO-01 TaxID=506668 RepID=UPI00085374F6|nr:methylglyoxal synthase [Bosea sp. BIWAKO-01]GAU84561.1 methylglyoxal synthase [Bosea sp. BIWAKO-01]
MTKRLGIGLIAHDRKKPDLAAWVTRNIQVLSAHRLVATATTGSVLKQSHPDVSVETVKSGPLGGDQQIGAMIAEGKIDVLIFFPDPLAAMPHDVDVKALLRLVLVYDIPAAFSPSTADALIMSDVFSPARKR